jgi:5-methylcytosine-specific restriction endonuclease McrA
MYLHPSMRPKKGIRKSRSKPTRHTKDGRLILSSADRTKQRLRLWNSRSHLCEICGMPIVYYAQMELDHKIPRGMGGGTRDDSDENQRVTHSWCNQAKGSKRDV